MINIPDHLKTPYIEDIFSLLVKKSQIKLLTILDCEFENIKDDLIRDRIVLCCKDTTIRETILQNPDLTMEWAINQGQAAEASQKQLRNIAKVSIDTIKKHKRKR
ncbi:hypothetical protein LAZ67_X001667 [Cordylochernes scorpioides]|uniref:Uncharacterized protein n=1 Tax=Cordylochernes scorpioides TaxID=51811 RepID=A0ABY6LTR3_9ARAC|nr:hypothetical protein LAZ67_X001667 [Cordylochernes scorpioides]